MNITVKKLAELHKPTHNIRRHSDKQITEYIRSIEMFGQVKPLVVAEDGEIIAGNGLYEALLRMGRHFSFHQKPPAGCQNSILQERSANVEADISFHHFFLLFTAADGLFNHLR